MTFRDTTRICVGCDAEYVWSEADQRFVRQIGHKKCGEVSRLWVAAASE